MSYRKTSEIGEKLKRFKTVEESNDFDHIRCPLCLWKPSRSSQWCCADCDAPEFFYGGCWTMWNTFETRGKCPTCAHQWRWTLCLQCTGWSNHEDWYVTKSS